MTTRDTEISVIVPFHDSGAFIRRCIESLLAQDYPQERYEILMVDNNSTDLSADIVRNYPKVTLLTEATPGSYAARNRAFRQSSGRIIAFTDSDCVVARDWLRQLSQALSAQGARLVQGPRRLANESWPLSAIADYEAAKAMYVASSRNPAIYHVHCANMAVHRDVFEALGPFEEVMRGADVLFAHRVLERYSFAGIRYAPRMLVRHLEIDSVWRWLKRMSTYGRSIRSYGDPERRRPLGGGDRLRVLAATLQSDRLSFTRTLALLVLLPVGAVFYEIGRRLRQP